MKNLMHSAISLRHAFANAFVQGLQIRRLVAVFLLGGILLLANINPASANTKFNQDSEVSNSRFLERMEKADAKSDRPKTTGELLDEARGDVPLGERMNNITRDSAEAFKQFGKLYTTGAEETARSLKENAENVLK